MSDPAPRPRRRRALWIGLALLVALAAAGALALPMIVEAALVRVADEVAGRYGADVRWAAADVRADGLTLTDVRFAADGVRGRVAEVDVSVGVWAALTGAVRVDGLVLIEPRLRIDGRAGAIDMPSDDSAIPSDDSEMPSDDSAMPFAGPFALPGGALLARLDGAPLPPVRIERPSLAVHRGGAVYRGLAARVTLLPSDGKWQIEASEGEVHLPGRRFTGLRLVGHVAAAGARVEIEPPPDSRVEVGPLTASVERLSIDMAPEALTVRLDGIDASLGDARAEGLSGSLRWTDRAEVTLADGTLRLPRWPAPEPPSPGGPAASGPSRVDTLAWRLPPMRAEGLTVELPGLPPLLEVGGRWHAGHLDGRAVLAGGEVVIAADIDPGRRRPYSARAELRGVRLAPLFARRLPPEPPRRPRRRTRADGVLDGHVVAAVVDRIGGEALGEARTLIEGRLAWGEGRVELAGLAEVPVDGIDLDATGRLDWDPAADLLAFEGRIAQGPLAMAGRGRVVDAVGDPRVHLEARGEPIDCAEAFAAIPAGLWGPYDRAALSGTLAPTFRLDWPVHRPATLELKIRELFKACEVSALAAREAPPATVDGRPAPGLDDVGWLDTRFVLPVREGTSEGAEVEVGPGVPGFVPLSQLPRYVGATMYQSEEMNFWRNNAIDRGLLVRALRIDLEAGRFVYGGSTVTQQLVKNLFLTRRKTLGRKLQELLVATRITQAIDRHRVLELYLNCIEFGPDVYGIGPAARYYFQKDARDLTPREAVFLAMLKPAPRRGAYYRRRGHGPTHGWWVERAEELMRRLVDNGQISAATAEAERPYHIEWVDRRYVAPARRAASPGDPSQPPAPPPAPPAPPPFGGSRLLIEP